MSFLTRLFGRLGSRTRAADEASASRNTVPIPQSRPESRLSAEAAPVRARPAMSARPRIEPTRASVRPAHTPVARRTETARVEREDAFDAEPLVSLVSEIARSPARTDESYSAARVCEVPASTHTPSPHYSAPVHHAPVHHAPVEHHAPTPTYTSDPSPSPSSCD